MQSPYLSFTISTLTLQFIKKILFDLVEYKVFLGVAMEFLTQFGEQNEILARHPSKRSC